MNENRLSIEIRNNGPEIIVHGEFNITKDDELFMRPDLYNILVMIIAYNSGHLVLCPF